MYRKYPALRKLSVGFGFTTNGDCVATVATKETVWDCGTVATKETVWRLCGTVGPGAGGLCVATVLDCIEIAAPRMVAFAPTNPIKGDILLSLNDATHPVGSSC